jgi:hypothetical protein
MGLADRLGSKEGVPASAARLRAGLGKLRRAYDYAGEVEHDPWDFAVEIQDLHGEGLDNSDFRWLVCKGYVEHAVEVRGSAEDRRAFRPSYGLRFCKRSCFVLTPSGAEFASHTLVPATNGISPGPPLTAPPAEALRSRPRWDHNRQELSVGQLVVKRFKVPAPNQEMVLAAFEEEGWPARIDDPIPPQGDIDPRRRLHDTINSLNGCHLHALIRFLGDGSGQGVRWELVVSPYAANGCASPGDGS